MRPYKITIFCFAVIGLLAVTCAAFPADGLKIGSFELNFPSIQEILHGDKADETPAETPEQLLARRLAEMKMNEEKQYLTFFAENAARIHFPNDSIAMFDRFFAALDNARMEPLRIVHYGDSQIEEDRITNVVRREFQERFGGNGVGLVPLIQTIPSQTIYQKASTGLPRFLVYGDTALRASNRFYGPMGQKCVVDTVISCRFANRASKSPKTPANYWNKLTLLVGEANLTATVSGNKRTISTEKKLETVVFNLPDSTTSTSLTLSGNGSVFGVMLDGKNGVSIDNIPMRGCSGTVFTKIDSEQLSTYYKTQNVRLIILQFGGNSVPYLKTENAINQYKNYLVKHINYLKKCAPKAEFLFIGPSDMATREKGVMQTYPMLPKVVKALREAAFEANAAYWDLYEVMGGHNSMVNWVKAQPPLAGKDYVHFTPLGAAKVGDMLYKSLMIYYDYYKWRQKTDEEFLQQTEAE